MAGENPFAASDPDRRAIWEMLVRRDSAFFLSGDWSLVADDYVEEGFLGVDAGRHGNAALWKVGFPTLADYRDAAIAGRLDPADFAEDLESAWLRCQTLTAIDIAGDLAISNKRIDGHIKRPHGNPLTCNWQSSFFLRRVDTNWKITGFVGYLPL